MLITRTPLRISLIGGGTDMPSYYTKRPGAVLSFTIDKYIYVSVNRHFGGGFRVAYSKTENVEHIDQIEHDLVRESLRLHNIKAGLEISSIADLPGSGTGMGSSSAFTVGLLKALGKDVPAGTLAERAYTVEAEKCFHAVGKQDQYAAAYGGMNFITFGKKNVSVKPLYVSKDWRDEFERNALLLWTGRTRDAREILKRQDKSFRDGGNIVLGEHLAHHAHVFYQELMDGASMRRLGELINQSWLLKRVLVEGIATPDIDKWYEAARARGAFGGKLLGAGGGGFLFLLAAPEYHRRIIEATGLRKVDFKITMEGSQVIYAD